MTSEQYNRSNNDKRVKDALGTLSKVDPWMMSKLRYRCVLRAIKSLSWCMRIVDDLDACNTKASKKGKHGKQS